MEEKKTNGLSIGGMITGILSIPLGCFGIFGIIAGTIGLVLSILGQKKEKSGMGLAGIITSAIGIVLGIAMIVLGIIGIALLENLQ